MLEGLFGPFVEFSFMRRALVGCLALAIAAPPLGVFLMLRRTSLTAEVLAHGVTPGIAAGFLIAGLSVPAMSLGGLVAGLAVALGAGALSRVTGGREDASLTALYLIALASGVALVSLRGDTADLTHLLFGQVLGVDDAALLLMAGVATITLPALALAWRPLALETFDPAFARAERAQGGLWHMLFLALVVLNVLAAFQAMGTMMAVGLMMLPAVSARLWVADVSAAIGVSMGIGVAASYIGLIISYQVAVPTGPVIILVCGAIYLVSLVFGRSSGLIRLLRGRQHLEA